MSLSIMYDGRKKVIKVSSPNVLIQSVLEEACNSFGLDAGKYELKHKKSTIDTAQPYRFCNVPNNASVDLVLKVGPRLSADVSIALSVSSDSDRGGQSFTGTLMGTFKSSATLTEMLQYFVAQGSLPIDILDSQDSSPEVIYLRSTFKVDELGSTTLASIGLTGQSVRFKLRFTRSSESQTATTTAPISDARSDASALLPTSLNDATRIASVTEPVDPQATSNSADTIKANVGETKDATATVPTRDLQPSTSALPTRSIQTAMLSVAQASPSAQSTSVESNITTNTTASITNTETNIAKAVSREWKPLPPLETFVHQILQSNFDRNSTPAVITLTKYVQNVIAAPSDNKFHTINASNKTFCEKVLPAKYAVHLLFRLGFLPTEMRDEVCSEAMNDPESFAAFLDQMSRVPVLSTLRLRHVNTSELAEAQALLFHAMDELQVDAESRPKMVDAAEVAARRAQLKQSMPEFDPYRSYVTRNSNQPQQVAEPASKLSTTELRLELLRQKRLELEGKKEDVDRCTEVLVPRSDGSMAQLQDFVTNPVETSNANNSSNRDEDQGPVPLSLMKSLLKKPEDDVPLTTKAVRDLQRAEKERVYQRTVVRIKFPDRVCVQGFFHPRHTVADLYRWVYSECIIDTELSKPFDAVVEKWRNSSKKRSVSAKETRAVVGFPFDLYTSPPRTVLVPQFAAADDETCVPTLSDLHFVPAALIHLSWLDSHPVTAQLKSSLDTKLGQCLSSSLQQQLQVKQDERMHSSAAKIGHSDTHSAPTTVYPTSAPLVEPTKLNSTMDKDSNAKQPAGNTSSEDKAGKKLGFLKSLIAPDKKRRL